MKKTLNKFTIPVILAATVMVAGMFAFMPVQQASTVHTSGTTTTANTLGLVCVDEETITLPATPDNDIITFTFSQPIQLTLISISADATLNGDLMNFDLWTVDGIVWSNSAINPNITDTAGGSFLTAAVGDGLDTMMVENTLAVRINSGTADQNDLLNFEFCGITQDAQDFDQTDITVVQTPV